MLFFVVFLLKAPDKISEKERDMEETRNKDGPHNTRRKALMRAYLIDLKYKAGLTTEILAESIYFDKKNYYQLESGERGHRMGALLYVRLAEELKVSVQELVNLEAEYQRRRIQLGYSKEPWYLVGRNETEKHEH